MKKEKVNLEKHSRRAAEKFRSKRRKTERAHKCRQPEVLAQQARRAAKKSFRNAWTKQKKKNEDLLRKMERGTHTRESPVWCVVSA
jgi:hypothetical protein